MIPYALPPAETKLAMRTLFGGYFANSHNFAEKLGNYLGSDGCIVANRASALLYVLFRYLRTRADKDKTEVLIPGYTCYSVPAAAVKAGLRVSLYDMHPGTFQPDLNALAERITDNTLAVVGQHLLGIRSDIENLTKTAHQHRIYCIEDSAQLLEKHCNVQQQETRADFTIFSFGRGKPLPLGSGGGLIAAKAKDLNSVSSELDFHPQGNGNYLLPLAVQIFSRPRVYWVLEKLPLGLGRTVFDPAFSVMKMPRLYQRIGVRALEELEAINRHRAAIVAIYHDHFSDKKNIGIKQDALACVRYPLLVQNRDSAEKLFNYGVRRLYPLALCDLPPLQGMLTGAKETPGAREIAADLITLPTHLAVSKMTATRIAFKVQKIFPHKTQVASCRPG